MEEKRKATVGKRVLAVLLLAVSMFVLQYTAKADIYLLEDMGERLFVGDTLTLSDYFDEYELNKAELSSIQYMISEESQNKDCITLTADGRVIAVKEGTAVITITYLLKEEATSHQEDFTVTVLPPEQVTAVYGTTIWLAAFDMYYPHASEESPSKYTYSFSTNSVALEQNGEGLAVCGFEAAKVYLQKDALNVLVAEITIEEPEFQKNKMARATQTEAFYPTLENFVLTVGRGPQDDTKEQTVEEGIIWSTDDEKVAVVSEEGIQAVAVGTTKVRAILTAKNGEKRTLSMQLTVTNPKASGKTFVAAVGVSKKLPVTGVCADSSYSYAEGIYYHYCSLTDTGKLQGEIAGTETITVLVDGREISIPVVITNPVYQNCKFTMYKGLKKNLTISGLSKKYSTISYQTGNAKIAAVAKTTGKVTAKKVGVTKITVNADGKKLTIWVEISTKKAYQAAKKEIAISKTKTHYSQAKRMSKGYYDCSSLVSRVYRQYGVYFGSKSGWSPTAAAIGQWCSTHNKVIAKKGVSYTKLVPGDLVFYSYGKNGRYKNITHVEMYVGNGMSVSASSSNDRVIHYGYSSYGVVLIARPTK